MHPHLDVLLIAAQWPERALLRAQLIDEGFAVAAVDAWPIPGEFARPPLKPRVVVIDLQGLPNADAALSGLAVLFPPSSVLVMTALGTRTSEDLTRLGFQVLARPLTVGAIAARIRALLDA
jgi:hypothetical protein